MPFRKAHFWVLALLALTFVAFWPTYFAKLLAAKQAWHVHAVGALLWTVLVIVQSWSINSGKRALHRQAGLTSFVLFPLFLIGGMMAIQAEAISLAAGPGLPENRFIGSFGFFDPLANIGYALLFYQGLKHRRNIQLHARYMLATVLFLVAPVIWRLLEVATSFTEADGPADPDQFYYAVAIGNAGAIAISYYLYRSAPKFGLPFLITIGFVVAQLVLFLTVGRMEAWARIFSQVAYADAVVLNVATGLAGLLVAWLGWQAGKQVDAPTAAVTAE